MISTWNERSEMRQLNVDELDVASGGGLFTWALTVAGFGTQATIYERLGGPDIGVGVCPAH